MTELELTRAPHDRRLYTLEGVGTIRLEGLFSSSATAHAGGDTWCIARRGLWHLIIEATDVCRRSRRQLHPARHPTRVRSLRWGRPRASAPTGQCAPRALRPP